MIYPIYIYGSPVLRKETEPVPADYPDFKSFVSDMFDTMYAADGVGLAAPQIGKSLRMFVIDATPFEEDDDRLAGFKKVFVNPDIYERSEETVSMGEGCLSFPKLNEDVTRSKSIRIRYQDENFAEHDEAYDGLAARIIQHEYDHIEGKVFTDHLSALRKTLIKNKLNAFTKGKYSARYKCKLVK